MREDFHNKSPGNALTANDINRLNRVSRRMARVSFGQQMKATQTGDLLAINGNRAWIQCRMLIKSEIDRKARTYDAEIRYYDKAVEQTVSASKVPDVWKTYTPEKLWELDALNIGQGYGPRLWPGDTVPAYWDAQRRMFVAISVPMRRKAITDVAILANGFGQVTFYINQASTTWKEDAWLNWLYTSDGLDANQRVIVQWYPDEIDANQTTIAGASVYGKWVIEVPWC